MKLQPILFFLILIPVYTFAQKKPDEPTSYKDDLSLDWKNTKDTLKLVAGNKLLAPIQIFFHAKKDSTELRSYLLPPKDSIQLITYSGSAPDSVFRTRINDSIRLSYSLGHESVIAPDLDYPYRFPFKKGKKYRVSQGFNGKRSHFSEKSRYAIDFQLEVGEAVHAARGGTVIKVIDWFTKQGGPELLDAANRIVILHEDGTMASYVHLEYKGSFVKEGETVVGGQKIGISGVTGYTRGPHLHFVVRKEKDIAIPVFFKGHMGEELKEGRKYKVLE